MAGRVRSAVRSARRPERRGQVSLELILVVAFTFAILIPGIYFFTSYSERSTQTLASTQFDRLGREMLSTAVKVSAQGEGTSIVLDVNIPESIEELRIAGDGGAARGDEIVITYYSGVGPSDAVFFAPGITLSMLPDKGSIFAGSPHGGRTRLRFTVENGLVYISEEAGLLCLNPENDCMPTIIEGNPRKCRHATLCTADNACMWEEDENPACVGSWEYDGDNGFRYCNYTRPADRECTFSGWSLCPPEQSSYCPVPGTHDAVNCYYDKYPVVEDCTDEGCNLSVMHITDQGGCALPCTPLTYPCGAECSPHSGWYCPDLEICTNKVDDDEDSWVDEADTGCGLELNLTPNPAFAGASILANLTAADGLLYAAKESTRYTKARLCDHLGCSHEESHVGECIGTTLCELTTTLQMTGDEGGDEYWSCTFTAPALANGTLYACLGENNVSVNLTLLDACAAGPLAGRFPYCRQVNITHGRPGVASAWHLDEAAGTKTYDTQEREGTLNGPTFIDAIFGTGLHFDGVDDVVTISQLLPSVKDNFTIELWAKPEQTHQIDFETTSGTAGVAGQRYAVFPRWGPNAEDASAGLSIGTNGVSVYEHSGGYLPALLVWQGTLTKWTHIVVVYEEQRPRLYINGDLVRTGLSSPRRDVYPSIELLGGHGYGYYSGSLDEYYVHDHALSEEEIKSAYHVGQRYAPDKPTVVPFTAQMFNHLDFQLKVPLDSLLPEGMLGSWHLNTAAGTDIFDSSGAERHGLIDGAAWTTGVEGSGLRFDGTDDYATLGNSTGFSTPTYTLSAWVNVDADAAETKTILARRGPYPNWKETNYLLRFVNGIPFVLHVTTYGVIHRVDGDTDLRGKGWTHVVATYDGARLRLIVDGVEEGAKNVEGPNQAGNQMLELGADRYDRESGQPIHFKGAMDEIRLFDEALNETEINRTYCTGAWRLNQTLTYPFPGWCVDVIRSRSYFWRDLRFTNLTDEEPLSHWVDDDRTAWVKLPELPLDGATAILLYYGNGTIGNGSSIAETFLFGDDFDDNSIDPLKWTARPASGPAALETRRRAVIQNDLTTVHAYFQSKGMYSAPYVLDMDARQLGSVEVVVHWDGVASTLNTRPENGYWAPKARRMIALPGEKIVNSLVIASSSLLLTRFIDGASLNLDTGSGLLSTHFQPYTTVTRLNGTTINVSIIGSEVLATTDATRRMGYIGLSSHPGTGVVSSEYDNVRLRKYTSYAPVVTVSEAEGVSGPACGGAEQGCCAESACAGGLLCCADSICRLECKETCGADGGVCCDGGGCLNKGSTCCPDNVCRTTCEIVCGKYGTPCCAERPECGFDLFCCVDTCIRRDEDC